MGWAPLQGSLCDVHECVQHGIQVANLSEVLRELQLLRVTREVQAVISKEAGAPGGAPLHAASKELQNIEDLMKHNDRFLAKRMSSQHVLVQTTKNCWAPRSASQARPRHFLLFFSVFGGFTGEMPILKQQVAHSGASGGTNISADGHRQHIAGYLAGCL